MRGRQSWASWEMTLRYGRFDDEQREYVISRPDTPLPWINYLGMEEYFGIISNTAGGYSFFRDARLRRVSRYRYNNAPFDLGGRYLYLRDDVTGESWSPSWQPTQTALDGYECRHGLSYTTIASTHLGVRAETLYCVPLGETLEVWRLRLANMTGERRARPGGDRTGPPPVGSSSGRMRRGRSSSASATGRTRSLRSSTLPAARWSAS